MQDQRVAQNKRLVAYRNTPLTNVQADHAIMSMYRNDVINVQRIPEVMNEWERPSHDYGDKSAWRLFNAATFALAGRVAEKPNTTRELHRIIDDACAVIF